MNENRSSGTIIGWKSGQTTYFPPWDQMKGSWLWTLDLRICDWRIMNWKKIEKQRWYVSGGTLLFDNSVFEIGPSIEIVAFLNSACEFKFLSLWTRFENTPFYLLCFPPPYGYGCEYFDWSCAIFLLPQGLFWQQDWNDFAGTQPCDLSVCLSLLATQIPASRICSWYIRLRVFFLHKSDLYGKVI